MTTPPALHLDLVLAALDAGKDVIVEKPAFTSAADGDLALAAVRRTGCRVLRTMWPELLQVLHRGGDPRYSLQDARRDLGYVDAIVSGG